MFFTLLVSHEVMSTLKTLPLNNLDMSTTPLVHDLVSWA